MDPLLTLRIARSDGSDAVHEGTSSLLFPAAAQRLIQEVGTR